MRDKSPHFIAVALLALLPFHALGASHRKPSIPPAPLVTLGNSTIPLEGPWKCSPGDSPWPIASSDGDVPPWAKPGFDDAAWTTVGLAPPAAPPDAAPAVTPTSATASTPPANPTPSNFAWARLRLLVADPRQQLWLKIPAGFAPAYELYANGQYVGQFGRFTANGVSTYLPQSAEFPLPQLPPNGLIELAVRLYTPSAATATTTPSLHHPPVLGLAPAIHVLQATENDASLHRFFGALLVAFLCLLLMALAFSAWIVDRHDYTWLWLFLALAQQVTSTGLQLLLSRTTSITAATGNFLIDVVLVPLGVLLWIVVWWSWFHLGRRRWVPILALLFAAAHIYTSLRLLAPALGNAATASAQPHLFYAASTLILAAQAILLLAVLVMGLRRSHDEALLAALPIFLLLFTEFTGPLFAAFAIPTYTYVLGLGVSLADVEQFAMIAVIAVLAVQRFLHASLHRSLSSHNVSQEFDQVRELRQCVLTSEEIHSPCFTIESEYHPAPIVGGDFFFTMLGLDGSLLVVIGDVSGRGTSAAMLVAVLMGAIRTRANSSFDPDSMLATLNDQFVGHTGGHLATCLVAHLRPNGQMRVANAGHLPPYLNGAELDLSGSLPLGIAGSVEPATQTFQLGAGDQLTFMTDGVVEAKDRRGNLFGFERATSISCESAAAIVRHVEDYGQDDDVTVLRIGFIGAPLDAVSRSYTFALD